jgi:peptide/nickel transport system substrate-binding protein
VTSIEKTGELEVTVRFSEPDVLFDRLLATPVGVVGSKKFIEKAGAAYGTPSAGVLCTGPFQLERWNPGSSIELVRILERLN